MSYATYSKSLLALATKNIGKQDVKSFYMFFLTASFGALVNFLSQIPFHDWFLSMDINPPEKALSWSIIASYLTATVVSFIPSKLFAFSAKGTGNTSRETIKFLIIALIALYIQESVTLFTLDNFANEYFPEVTKFRKEKASHLVGMGVSFLANFFGHRLITFKSTGIYNKMKPNR